VSDRLAFGDLSKVKLEQEPKAMGKVNSKDRNEETWKCTTGLETGNMIDAAI